MRTGSHVAGPDQHRTILIAVLRRAEPERPTHAQRTSCAPGQLLAIERRGVVCDRSAVAGSPCHAPVARKERDRPAQAVGPGLGDHVDHRGAGAPRFRREPVRRDLELLHGLLGYVLQRPPNHIVVVVGPVDGDVPAAAQLPRRGDHHSVRLRRIEVGCGRIAGRKQGELQEVAAVQRQLLDRPGRQDGIHHRARRIHGLRRCGDVHRLLHSSHHQLHIDGCRTANLEDDPGATGVREPSGRNHHVDDGWQEGGDDEGAVARGWNDPDQRGSPAPHRDRGRPDGRGLGIHDTAAQRGCDRLGAHRCDLQNGNG